MSALQTGANRSGSSLLGQYHARCNLDPSFHFHCNQPICIARKAIRATQFIGMVGRESLFADNHWMRNGSASREICWERSPLRCIWLSGSCGRLIVGFRGECPRGINLFGVLRFAFGASRGARHVRRSDIRIAFGTQVSKTCRRRECEGRLF